MEMNTDTNGETPKMSTRYIDAADVAKLVRSELKFFEGTKFYVRTSKYAGGASVRVRWADGPTVDEVKAVAGHLHGATFDGMIDLQSYHDSDLDGETVHFGNSFIFFERDISIDLWMETLGFVAHDWGQHVLQFTVEETHFENRPIGAYFAGHEIIEGMDTMTLQRIHGDEIRKTSVRSNDALAQTIS